MKIHELKDVDLLYVLFLGRVPENNFVRTDNIGRPISDMIKTMIESDEFERFVYNRFLQHGSLPHDGVSLQVLPEVLEFLSSKALCPPNQEATSVGWQEVLGRVLASSPCRELVQARYGE